MLVLTNGQTEYGHEGEDLQANQEHPRQDLQARRVGVQLIAQVHWCSWTSAGGRVDRCSMQKVEVVH